MKYRITAFPYAIQYGTIEVPDDVPEEEIDNYIETYWEKIEFEEPELDYSNTDFDKEKEESHERI